MTTNQIEQLAESWVNTDTGSIRDDVRRLGSVQAAADYSADMAIGQEQWEPLSTDEGRAALRKVIQNIAVN